MAEASNHQIVMCRVKWFNPKKGFGFLTPEIEGPDILLHANVLRTAGRGSIADGVRLEVEVRQVGERWQAIAISKIHAGTGHAIPRLEQLAAINPDSFSALPYQPARVKWFDHDKGFGFANVYGLSADVFIHIEVLRSSGLANLEAGEAVALRVIDGDRGLMAAEVADWMSSS